MHETILNENGGDILDKQMGQQHQEDVYQFLPWELLVGNRAQAIEEVISRIPSAIMPGKKDAILRMK